jgi:hypothetical protein
LKYGEFGGIKNIYLFLAKKVLGPSQAPFFFGLQSGKNLAKIKNKNHWTRLV